ncbi:universal stress protein [Streptomyces sp. 11x1]|uniref:universal stress protein n=1 Tax=Streptomyces sp. 11x1 TaxID=3038642 RepID=UPI002931B482|nr:universal stress protein [Streptomyces sp. 11x1]
MVLGLDTRRPCDELIEFAFGSARRRDARLHVIHVISASSELTEDSRPEPVSGVPVVETVAEGRVTAELVRASTGASLAVVGRRTRDGRPGSHIGRVTHAVLHHVGCPVAVVPHD